MPDEKISELDAVTDVQGTDEYVLARAGATNKITATNLAAGIGGGGGVDSIEADSGGQLTGDVTFSEGSNITLTTAGNDIEIAASGGAGATEMAYVEFTTPVTISGTNEAGRQSVVSAGSVAFDGATRVCIEFYCPQLSLGGNGNSMTVVLDDGGTAIGWIGKYESWSATAGGYGVLLRRWLTPSNASHTYQIMAFRGSANGTFTVDAGGAGVHMPGYVRITSGI